MAVPVFKVNCVAFWYPAGHAEAGTATSARRRTVAKRSFFGLPDPLTRDGEQ